MHPLMNRFNTDEQRRLMELLCVRESSAPLLSRRVFLQSAAATGLVLFFTAAIVTHLHAGYYNIAFPIAYLLPAAASLVLGVYLL